MTAILAVNKLREDPNRDQIVRDYMKSLPKKSDDYSAWEYVTKDSNHDNHTPFHAAYCSLYQTSLIKSKLWEAHLTPAEKKLIKKVAMSYTATSERETWFFGYGKGHYNVNSDEIPDGKPIEPTLGAGCLVLTPDGRLMELKPKENPEVELEITSWRGISIGAEHYYAKLNCYPFRPSTVYVKKKKDDTYSSGSLSDYITPRIARISDITVRRPLLKSDIRETKSRGNPDRYESYDIGDFIDGFWTEEAAIEYGTKTFNKLFDQNSVKLTVNR